MVLQLLIEVVIYQQNSSLGCVKLYIPSSLEYKYSANWNKVSFGALGAAFGGAGAAIGAAGATGLNSLFN